MANAELSTKWWEKNKPENWKEKDLERALGLFENQQRALEKSQEPGLQQKLADALALVHKALDKTIKGLDKKTDKDLIGQLQDLDKLAGKAVRQAESNQISESSEGAKKALQKLKKVELSSAWWGEVRNDLGMKSKKLELALGALENAHRGFESGAPGEWAKQIGDLFKLIKAGAADALKEVDAQFRKELAPALVQLIKLAEKDAKERGAL